MTQTTEYPQGFETDSTSDTTRAAYAKLMEAAAKRPKVSERTMDRLRVRWNLCQLEDDGIVRDWYGSGGVGTYIDARGSRGMRCYQTTRELEAFVHGAMAAMDR